MNEQQIAWMIQMRSNLDTISSDNLGMHDAIVLHGKTRGKIFEACSRLGIKKSSNLAKCLDNIDNHFYGLDDSPFDEEKEWEKHCDYQHFLRHGNDPWWAQ